MRAWAGAGLAIGLAMAAVACGSRSSEPPPAADKASLPHVRYPATDEGVDSLPARRRAQLEAAAALAVPHDFHFADRLAESGITFVHHIVEDAGVHYKAVHYDHGSGLAVADVDGDGREDLFFVNQVGGNELWKNAGGGRFTNITKEAGVALAERISVGASFADIDNDGDQDLFVTTVRGGNALFENDGRGHFRDITKDAGLALVAHSSGAVFFDYDNDGLVDLFVTNVGRYTSDVKGPDGAFVGLPDAFFGHMHPERFEQPVLYKNLGHNKFRDVTAEVGLRPVGWAGDATFGDLNGDGRPDLFVLNMMGAQHAYENVGGKTFSDRTQQYFPRAPWGAMGVKFLDFDNDGRPDLFITDMHSDMYEDVGPDREKLKARVHPQVEDAARADAFVFGNAFYHNLGHGRFEEVSDRVGAETYWPWGISAGDVNADGWEDVFVTGGMNFPFRYGINSLLLNVRGTKFADAEFVLGVEPRRDGRTHTPWFELDCAADKPDDPLWRHGSPCRGQTGHIIVMAPLASRSSAIFDLDDDGDLDIVTNDFNSEPQVLVSDLAQRGPIAWLKVALAGTASNRNGLGATVRVRAGGHTYTRYNDGKSGYLSQSVLPLYFGLGDAKAVDRVEVDWPSGRKQVVAAVRLNSRVQIVEPK